jgi:PEP-CTERM motif
MPRIRDYLFPLAVALLALAAGAHSARADLVTSLTVTTMPATGGLTEYDYTLTNLPASTITASFFFVAVDPTANLSFLTAPAGWDISYATGDSAVGFTSPDPSVDIVPGSFGLFSFDSPLLPIQASYEVAGIDANSNFVTNNGMIASASVPEPATVVLLTAGVLGMLGVRRRLKRSRSTPASSGSGRRSRLLQIV